MELFRNRPSLTPELLREALHLDLPKFTEARIDSADLTDVQPAEYRADLVVRLLDGVSVLGVVVEVQLSRDDCKQFAWPAYVATLRRRLKCPVCLLVVTVDEAIARWAAKPIEMGCGNRFVPLVLGPSAAERAARALNTVPRKVPPLRRDCELQTYGFSWQSVPIYLVGLAAIPGSLRKAPDPVLVQLAAWSRRRRNVDGGVAGHGANET